MEKKVASFEMKVVPSAEWFCIKASLGDDLHNVLFFFTSSGGEGVGGRRRRRRFGNPIMQITLPGFLIIGRCLREARERNVPHVFPQLSHISFADGIA